MSRLVAAWSSWKLIEIGVSVVLNAGILTLLYKWPPKVRIHWSEAVRGGVLAATLWETERVGLTWLMMNEIGKDGNLDR